MQARFLLVFTLLLASALARAEHVDLNQLAEMPLPQGPLPSVEELMQKLRPADSGELQPQPGKAPKGGHNHSHHEEIPEEGTAEIEGTIYVGRRPAQSSFKADGQPLENGAVYVAREPDTKSFVNGGSGNANGAVYVGRDPDQTSFINPGLPQSRGIVHVGR